MKKTLFLIFSVPCALTAQQLSPTELIATPQTNKFAISGIGGGNLYELNKKTGSSSAQIAIDWNLFNGPGTTHSGNRKIFTLATVFRYNPVITTRLLSKDSLLVKKLPFTDNEYLFHFGIRARTLRKMGDHFNSDEDETNANFLRGGFFDMLYTPYTIRLSDTVSTGFQTLNMNGGYQVGFYSTYSSIGAIGISFSLQTNFLMVIENYDDPNGFEKSVRSTSNLPSNLLGGGGKFVFQLNDFSIYFEMRNYWPVNSSNGIKGLTNSPIISFGALATGTAFKSGKKQENSNW